MLARPERELPGGDFLYEPKWDGFRCLAAAAADTVELHSRHGRPLARYFPEVASAIRALARGRRLLLDGELVLERGGAYDFGALLGRMHPAASRVAHLVREAPATYVAFDLLAVGGEELVAAPLVRRREELERLLHPPPDGVVLTPATRDRSVARGWLAREGESGVDGVVAKALDGRYLPNARGWVKVKRVRTADCVLAGARLFCGEPAVASLLLGLWDGPRLRHVGVASSFTDAQRSALAAALLPIATRLEGHPWERGFGLEPSPIGRLAGSAGRWEPGAMDLDWTPLRPERVCEVAYDQLDAGRFRHPARFLRWRPDRAPRSCGFDQLGIEPGGAAAGRARAPHQEP